MTETLIVARFVHIAASVLLFGVALYALYGVVEHITPAAGPLRRIRRLMQTGAIVSLLSAVAWFAESIAAMNGEWMDNFDVSTLSDVVSDGDFGTLWLVRMLLILVLIVLSCIPAVIGAPRGRIAFVVVAAIALASLSLTGHTSQPRGDLNIVHRIADAIHLLAAGAWLGGLAGLSLTIRSALKTPSEASAAHVRVTLPRFSRLGYWAVGLVVITGAIKSLFLVGQFDLLFSTDYGQLLVVKIVLALCMIGLACANRFRTTPKLLSQPGPAPAALGSLTRNVLAEQVLGFAILIAVALLGNMPPAIFSAP